MEIYYEGKGYLKEQWPPTAATFFSGTASHWYTHWRNSNKEVGIALTWKDMIATMKRNLVSEDLEWMAQIKMVTAEYRGDISKHIDHYLRLVDPI